MDPELKSKFDYMTSVALVNAKRTSQENLDKIEKMLTIWILF